MALGGETVSSHLYQIRGIWFWPEWRVNTLIKYSAVSSLEIGKLKCGINVSELEEMPRYCWKLNAQYSMRIVYWVWLITPSNALEVSNMSIAHEWRRHKRTNDEKTGSSAKLGHINQTGTSTITHRRVLRETRESHNWVKLQKRDRGERKFAISGNDIRRHGGHCSYTINRVECSYPRTNGRRISQAKKTPMTSQWSRERTHTHVL